MASAMTKINHPRSPVPADKSSFSNDTDTKGTV